MAELAAFGVACNAMQVIDFGIQTIALCWKIYKHGSLEEHAAMDDRSKKVSESAKDLRQWLGQLKSRRSLSATESQLQEIASKCADAADELHSRIEKITGGVNSGLLGTLQKTGRTIRNKSKIESMEANLFKYQQVLETQILVHMEYALRSIFVSPSHPSYALSRNMKF